MVSVAQFLRWVTASENFNLGTKSGQPIPSPTLIFHKPCTICHTYRKSEFVKDFT
jgi:hypothetical protein